MELDKLLDTLENDNGSVKTASAPAEGGTGTALQAALKTSLQKTAAAAASVPVAANPVDTLEKLAEDIAGTEKEAEVVHAATMGRAFADAALEQFSALDAKVAHLQQPVPLAPVAAPAQSSEVDNAIKLAAEIGYNDTKERIAEEIFTDKMASATPYQREELVKVAADAGREDLLVKAAAERGYQETIEKVATAQYAAGESEALSQVHDTAAGEFLKGAQETSILIDKARQASPQ